jgi:hypothetical protein
VTVPMEREGQNFRIGQRILVLLIMSAMCLLHLRKTPAFPSYPKRKLEAETPFLYF